MGGDGGDRIEVRDLRIVGVCGVLREERERPQPLSVDVDVSVDLSRSGRTDRLEDTVDYGELVVGIAATLLGGSFNLLEAAAEAVAGAVLGLDRRVTAVTVVVRKVRPPVPYDMGSAGARVHRSR